MYDVHCHIGQLSDACGVYVQGYEVKVTQQPVVVK